MLSQSDVENIKSGNSVLLLGAGASVGSTRYGADKRPILDARKLAAFIAEKIEVEFENDSLRDTYAAAKNRKSKEWVHKLLESEYTGIVPNDSLRKVFSYPWYRIYTLNIDDSLKNVPNADRVQKVSFINGVGADRSEWQGRMHCQVVHLHGAVWEIEKGVVFSDEEFGSVYERRLGWYQQLREDFRTRNVYIVGSEMDEPFILSLIKSEISSLRDASSAKLIIPSKLSQIRQDSLRSASIEYSKGTLSDFTDFLYKNIGQNYSPKNIVSNETDIEESLLSKFDERDISALSGLFRLDTKYVAKLKGRSSSEKSKERNSFFQGYGPNWGVIADSAIAELDQFDSLDIKVLESVRNNPVTIVTGEAGSGKSTYNFRFLKNLVNNSEFTLFQYRETSASFFEVMAALRHLLNGKMAIVLIEDLHIYAEDLSEYLAKSPGSNIHFLSSARTAEWRARISNLFNRQVNYFELNRFTEADNHKIVDLIELSYVAPEFNKLNRAERLGRLFRSKKQILFAIREASQSKIFDEIIKDEVASINDERQKRLLILVSFATAARVGIREDVAASILDIASNEEFVGGFEKTFSDVIYALDGIVGKSANGALKVRHDTYAFQVLEKHLSKDESINIIQSIVSYFSQYKTPIISNITKADGQLFKFVLNNRNIYNFYFERGFEGRAINIYSEMEQRLQLDGHYWLQYGLLLRRMGHHLNALDKFEKSIEAYDQNEFAFHALAQQKLIIAATTNEISKKTYDLISEAEEYLVGRHHVPNDNYKLDLDEYPLTVLGNYHIDCLVHLEKYDDARNCAKKYYRWIVDFEKNANRLLNFDSLKERIFRFITLGEWKRNVYKIGSTIYYEHD